ncbi:MAG: hypothetical protein ACR2KT_03385 [Methylocella sp.]
MAQRQIGQDSFHFGAKTGRQTSLDELSALLDWSLAERVLAGLYASAKGEKARPELARHATNRSARQGCRGSMAPRPLR